jgi:hypothetical protein
MAIKVSEVMVDVEPSFAKAWEGAEGKGGNNEASTSQHRIGHGRA